MTTLLPSNVTGEDVRAALGAMSAAELRALAFDWSIWARPEQLMPAGDWRTWLIMAGRGFGKTRTGAEAVRQLVYGLPAGGRIALIAPTSADCRDVIVEGESGMMHVFPPDQRPIYEPSKRRVTFRNGVLGFLYSAEEPERLRGPQHHHAYCDEIAVYPDPKALFDNLRFGLRLGANPRILATTTPRAGHKFLVELLADPMTRVSRGSTYANRANLPAAVLADFERIYGGTRIGRQELEGELLAEAEGALWRGAQIEALRVRVAPDLVRVVVGVDPSVTSGPNSDEVGIVVAGLGADGHGYVLQDLSGRMSPDDWAQRVVAGFDRHDADKIIAEANNGGDLIASVMRTVRVNIPFEKVHASRGKITRAEPVAALYEQGKVHHVGGFAALETEMTTYVAGESASPNRMDALVWALSFLMLKPAKQGRSLSL
jgi:predicted phage terminase large subunit-like protein